MRSSSTRHQLPLGERAWSVATLVEAADILTRTAEERLAFGPGLTLSEKEVLFRLHLAGGRMRMTDLARTLLFSPGGATRLVDRMTARGWVERYGDECDRRTTLVAVTTAGRQAFQDSAPVMESVVNDVLDPYVSDAELVTLTRILTKVVEGNGRWQARLAGKEYETAIRSVS